MGRFKLPSELDKPFAYLDLVTDFNGIDIEQSRDYIQSYCNNYIYRVMVSHRWNAYKSKVPAKPPSTLTPDSSNHLFSHSRPK